MEVPFVPNDDDPIAAMRYYWAKVRSVMAKLWPKSPAKTEPTHFPVVLRKLVVSATGAVVPVCIGFGQQATSTLVVFAWYGTAMAYVVVAAFVWEDLATLPKVERLVVTSIVVLLTAVLFNLGVRSASTYEQSIFHNNMIADANESRLHAKGKLIVAGDVTNIPKKVPTPMPHATGGPVPPACYIFPNGQVIQGHLILLIANQTRVPVDDVDVDIVAAYSKAVNVEPNAVNWADHVKWGTCKALLTTQFVIPQREITLGAWPRYQFSFVMTTRADGMLRETMDLSKINDSRWTATTKFYKATDTKPGYANTAILTLTNFPVASPSKPTPLTGENKQIIDKIIQEYRGHNNGTTPTVAQINEILREQGQPFSIVCPPPMTLNNSVGASIDNNTFTVAPGCPAIEVNNSVGAKVKDNSIQQK